MNNLDDIAEKIEAEMDEKDEVREVALKSSRSVIRLCSSAIRMIHKDVEKAGEYLESVLGARRRDFYRVIRDETRSWR